MKILVDNEDEQKVIEQILKTWAESGIGISEIARKLNEQGIVPPPRKEDQESDLQPAPADGTDFSEADQYAVGIGRCGADSGPAGARPYRAANCVDFERTGVDSAQREAVHRERIHGLLRTIQATKVLSPRGIWR